MLVGRDTGSATTLSGNPNPVRRTWMPPYAITIEVITTSLLAIRLASRFKHLGGRPGLDDVFVTTAWVLGIGMTIAVCYSMYNKYSTM